MGWKTDTGAARDLRGSGTTLTYGVVAEATKAAGGEDNTTVVPVRTNIQ